MFCQYYVGSFETFGNAAQSYAKAYGKDMSDKKQNNICRVEGFKLLTKPNIIDRVNELLNNLIMNDTSVDTELGFLIMQRLDFSAKIQAIREYNKLKQRITDKAEIHINPVKEIIDKYGKGKVDDVPRSDSAKE